MPELDTAKRNRLRDPSFASFDRKGERHLPINDEAHVRNAIARFGQTDFGSAEAKRSAARRVLAAAKRRGIELDDASDVRRATRR